MEKLDARQLKKKANELRIVCLEMLKVAGSGHVGGSLSAMDILTALYFNILNINPENPKDNGRDRFILSGGHKAAAYVAVLAARGFFDVELLKTFNKMDSPFGMHPDMHKIRGCDMSTGSLGHGLPVGVGMALALRMDNIKSKVVILMGDGETHEGTVWESAMGAAHYKLDNMVAILDYNKCSMDGPIESILNIEPVADKWKSFGWGIRRINGHNMDEILAAFDNLPDEGGKPTVIIADTIKGKGIPSVEGNYTCHYAVCSGDMINECKLQVDKKE
jgi:transketolase